MPQDTVFVGARALLRKPNSCRDRLNERHRAGARQSTRSDCERPSTYDDRLGAFAGGALTGVEQRWLKEGWVCHHRLRVSLGQEHAAELRRKA